MCGHFPKKKKRWKMKIMEKMCLRILYNPLDKRASGDICAKLYCVASCTFRATFKVKCPVIGTKMLMFYRVK